MAEDGSQGHVRARLDRWAVENVPVSEASGVKGT